MTPPINPDPLVAPAPSPSEKVGGEKHLGDGAPFASKAGEAPRQIDRFVFLDDRPWPFMVSNQSGTYWLYYWADSYKNFATMRKLGDDEIERFRIMALPQNRADLYLNYGGKS